MQITNDNLSFQSKIKLIDLKTFREKTANLSKRKCYVGYPWTPDTMKSWKKLYTKGVQDCISGVIIDDNHKPLMFHIATRSQKQAKKDHQKGFDIKNIERRIIEKINPESENIHAFILGGCQFYEDSKYNHKKVNSVRKIFEKHNIPYSEITCRRDTHIFGSYGVLYDKKEDTIYINNTLMDDNEFSKITLNDDSTVSYTTYGPSPNYKRTQRRTGIKEFLESQFRNVKLSKFDEFA